MRTAKPPPGLATSYYATHAVVHDAITTRRGSHRRTRANIAEAWRRGIALRAGVVAVDENQDVSATLADLEALGIVDIGVDHLRQVGRGVRDDRPGVEQLCGRCADGSLAVSPTGKVWPCVFARWLALGNVRELGLAAINDAAQEVRAGRRAPPELLDPGGRLCTQGLPAQDAALHALLRLQTEAGSQRLPAEVIMTEAQLLERMVDQLIGEDASIPREWERAFRRVRRDRFLGDFYYQPAGSDQWQLTRRRDQPERWKELVYSHDEVLVTSLGEHGEPVSSSSMPNVMTRFLTLLDVHDGDRVLEIGTGTGYNAALLCARLGSALVTTVDADADLVTSAQKRLTDVGSRPTVAHADGYFRYPPGAPCDRIIATCSVARIPEPWIDQLGPGGVVVAPMSGGRIKSGFLVALRAQPDRSLVGRCDEMGVAFMALHSPALAAPSARQELSMTNIETRVVAELGVWAIDGRASAAQNLYAGLKVADLDFGWSRDERGRSECALAGWEDGSWARLMPHGDTGYTLTQGGPRRLWDLYEAAVEEWIRLERPDWSHYGICITPDRRQYVWLDNRQSEHRWEL